MAPKKLTGIRLDEPQLAEAAALAAREQRTTAAMLRILIGEALAARRAKGAR